MKAAFSRFLEAVPDRLHAAAHSHHPWPDVSLNAHIRAWEDAARMMDDKWDHIFGEIFLSARSRVAAVLGLPDPDTLVFAPNTHEFVVRIASTLPDPFTVLTTDSEFHSFSRQLTRWEEAGTAAATRVPAEPYDTFPERFVGAFEGHDLVFFSHVHFNSGYVVEDLAATVQALGGDPVIVVDGYHGFMAVPTHLGEVGDRAFYLAGGYKYAMSGEGACFLHVPPSAAARPPNTGWWAGFDALTESPEVVPYSADGRRFGGATFDPSGVYRLEAVLGWLEREGWTVPGIHTHVRGLQERLLAGLEDEWVSRLIPGREVGDRGHFLTFRHPDAAGCYERLRRQQIITDYRDDRWRIGLGMYHDVDDVDRLSGAVSRLA